LSNASVSRARIAVRILPSYPWQEAVTTVGKTIRRYEVVEPLDAGGMGDVYLGKDTRLSHKVALERVPTWCEELKPAGARKE